MYSVVRIFEGHRHAVSEAEQARARVEDMARTAGFVTLLAIKGDEGSLVTVEIFETLDDMRTALGVAGNVERRSSPEGGPEGGTTIAGEIVFQRGL